MAEHGEAHSCLSIPCSRGADPPRSTQHAALTERVGQGLWCTDTLGGVVCGPGVERIAGALRGSGIRWLQLGGDLIGHSGVRFPLSSGWPLVLRGLGFESGVQGLKGRGFVLFVFLASSEAFPTGHKRCAMPGTGIQLRFPASSCGETAHTAAPHVGAMQSASPHVGAMQS
eukprot:2766299-Rhodomonas_salina.1